MIGKTISDFQITERLGEGGMGTVYKATDQRLKRTVAIKMLHPFLVNNPDSFRRFQNEAHLSARISHPNVATLFNFQEAEGSHFIVMEYVSGKALDDILTLQNSLPEKEAVKIILQVLEGLGAAHELGIMHRDLKPGNIMITRRGYVKLMDFGIARLESAERMTRQNNVIGTLEYLAPELLKGSEPSMVSDLYAVGVMLYEMLSGQTLFAGDSEAALIFQIAHKHPNIQLPNHDKRLVQIIKKLTNKNPSKRYQSTQEVIQELERICANGKVNTRLLEQKIVEEKQSSDNSIQLPLKIAVPQVQVQVPKVQIPKEKLENLPVDWRIIAGALVLSLTIFIIGLSSSSESGRKEAGELSSEMVENTSSSETDLDGVNPLNAIPDPGSPQSEIEFIEKFDLKDDSPKSNEQKAERKNVEEEEKSVEKKATAENRSATSERSKNNTDDSQESRSTADEKTISDKFSSATESVKTFAGNVKEKVLGNDSQEKEDKGPTQPNNRTPVEPSKPDKTKEPTAFTIRITPKSLSARFAQEVSSDVNRVGQTVYLYTTHEVEQQGQLVIKEGANIKGVIKELVKGGKGERAFLSIQLTSVQAANGNWLAVSYPPITENGYKEAKFKKDGPKFYKIRLEATNYQP